MSDGSCNWLGGRLYRVCMKEFKTKPREPSRRKIIGFNNNRQQNTLIWNKYNKYEKPTSNEPNLRRPYPNKHPYHRRFNGIKKPYGHRNRIGYITYNKEG